MADPTSTCRLHHHRPHTACRQDVSYTHRGTSICLRKQIWLLNHSEPIHRSCRPASASATAAAPWQRRQWSISAASCRLLTVCIYDGDLLTTKIKRCNVAIVTYYGLRNINRKLKVICQIAWSSMTSRNIWRSFYTSEASDHSKIIFRRMVHISLA